NLDNQINGKGGLADEVEKQGYKVDTALKVEGNGVLYNHGTDLTTGINLNTSAIEQEVKDRETADQKLQQGITTNTAAINSVKTTVGSGVLTSGAADLTTGINQNYAQIQQNTNAINSLDSRVDDLGGEIDQVGAVSAALAGLHPLDYDGTGSKFQLSAAMGSYDSSQAAAIGAFYHFNRDVMISLGGATSFDGDHKTAGNLGVTFRIGEGASGKAVSDDVMARLEAMDRKITALEQENKDLKNVLGAIDTSLSKEFPDVPANHWAYEAVTKLAGNDVVAGYPDGEFHGDRTMTRYEMAEVIYKAMQKGAKVDQKLVNEFKPEMEQVAANQNA
ncbi:S-layer homology domain-containing protein, partial [Megasphaera elsdenii]|uniref:S-layer homology domain-containing protein n=1 Tax=Megasphaera elsdenii TaxID=907 RepID=UPI00195B0C8E